jgi:hypothetical protein
MYQWMDESKNIWICMNVWMLHVYMHGWIDECMTMYDVCLCLNEWMNQWINESMNEWMNEYMNQWVNIYARMNVSKSAFMNYCIIESIYPLMD